LSRAIDIIPCLQKHGEVDILVSGIQGDLELPFAIKYKLKGLSFIFGKKGGVDLLKTCHPEPSAEIIQKHSGFASNGL